MKSRRYKSLASIAYALGFADQSHFIRDLKAFSNVTPKSLSDRADQFHEQAGFSYED
jgi:AraC-like DNA-binding protein